MARMVLGIFSDRTEAENAIVTLEEEGYNPKDISIVMKSKEDAQHLSHNTGASVTGGAASGIVAGGTLGALAGMLVATGVVPGLGVLLIGGPLASALGLTGTIATAVSGAATGALAGGVLGALAGLGIPEEDAKAYEESIKQGAILLAVPSNEGEDSEVRRIMEDHGAFQIRTVTTERTQADTGREVEEGSMYTPTYYSRVNKGKGKRR